MTPLEILYRATTLGLKLEAQGDELIYYPKSHCPPEFLSVLREHKSELLAWLRGGDDYWRERPKPDLDLSESFLATFPPVTGPRPPRPLPPPDPWLHVAVQVINGEFADADSSTIESLTTGLRHNPNPICRQAMALLPKNKETP